MEHPKIMYNGELVHTTNSDGNRIHETDEGVKNFHNWFHGSTAVDEHGRPKVFYHGSVHKDLKEFNPNIDPVRPRTGPNGTYFTTSQVAASNYTLPPIKIGGKPAVKPVRGSVTAAYLAIKNPLDITSDVKKHIKSGLTFSNAKKKAIEKLDTSKHDSVVFRGNSMNPDEYISLHPYQIKSVKNVGSFSAKTNKINECESFKEYLYRVREYRLWH